MDFFSAQDAARSHTTRLVILFLVAVLSLIALTNLVVMGFMTYLDFQMGSFDAVLTGPDGAHSPGALKAFFAKFDWGRFFMIGAAVTLVVGAGSLYKILSLRGGGRVVAESLGGRLISQDSGDPRYRKVLNVVEEMAIAAGTPVPPVYVLEQEEGINAFASGYTPGDAVIGVTRGCIEQLNREQLQGVIAHEFSHILNGDMRLNLRLIGILHGILLIGLIGYFILRSGFYTSGHRSSSRNSSGGLPLLALGAGLAIVGYTGTFFGNLIKASVSRQREYLADASAVQFTRNPGGIAGALKRIGGFKAGSRLESPQAPQMSHAFFSAGVQSFFGSLLATHPPLEKRIRRIQPSWRGKFDSGDTPAAEVAPQPTGATAAFAAGAPATAAAVAAEAIHDIGQPQQKHLSYAESLINELPAAIRWAAREPYGARALIYSLVLDSDPEMLQRQLALLDARADIGVHDQARLLQPQIRGMERKYRLTLVDMAMPALRQLSAAQYALFKENLSELIRIDRKVTLFEWSLQKIVLHNLDADFLERRPPDAVYGSAVKLQDECALVFSVLAYSQRAGSGSAANAFAAARAELGVDGIELLERKHIKLDALDRALDRLARLKPLAKPPLLKACAAGILANSDVSPKEIELLRAISSILDCPMPPVVV